MTGLPVEPSLAVAESAEFVDPAAGVECLRTELGWLRAELAHANDELRLLRASETRLRELSVIVEHSADAISLASADGIIQYINRSFERMSGYTAAALIGNRYSLLQSGEHDRDFYRDMWATISAGRVFQCHMVNRHKSGRRFHVLKTITPIMGADGRVISHTCVDKDYNAEVQARAQIDHLAMHDPLTGLANRILLDDRVQHAIARSHRQDGGFALIYLDIDDFKPINDHFGHAAGDTVLKAIATRLKVCTRDMDTVARIGGDEFVILLEDTVTATQSIQVARKMVGVVNQPIVIGAREVRLSASVGVSRYRTHGRKAAKLLLAADEAMYRAKTLGKNRAICAGCAVEGQCDDSCSDPASA